MTKKLDEVFYASNAVFLEELLDMYIKDSSSVDIDWQEFFKHFTEEENNRAKTTSQVIHKNTVQEECSQTKLSDFNNTFSIQHIKKEIIEYFRNLGGNFADLNPLNKNFSTISIEDICRKFNITNNILNLTTDFLEQSISLKNFIYALVQIYSNKLSVEFSHITQDSEREWLFERFEKYSLSKIRDKEEKIKYLDKIISVKSFEQYIHTKFPGTKRFSIEGGEAALLAIDKIIENFAQSAVKSCIIAMAHRGRLSLLTNIMGKKERDLFSDFLGAPNLIKDMAISADVKYHIGFSSKKNIGENEIELYLASNPSHLEAVNTVACGNIRALQDKLNKDEKYTISGIMIHGDASFAGQGVVYETIMSSKLEQYDVGGVVHVIINNQIGYTTNYYEVISGKYCSNLSKVNEIPVIHVNGDDLESVLLAAEFACQYKLKFKKDIILDVICYRRYGHNEGDDPSYTQPTLYKQIENKKDLSTLYSEMLEQASIINKGYHAKKQAEIKKYLDNEFDNVHHKQGLSEIFGYKVKEDFLQFIQYNRELDMIDTSITQKQLTLLSTKISYIPENFHIHPKLKILLEKKDDLLIQNTIDWAMAEYIAFGSLLLEKFDIRIIGQDTERGTFAHRHAVLHDVDNDNKFVSLKNLNHNQGNFNIYNGNLSEYAALGFEFGYSLFNHKTLVIWEAQFGDFFNGAQIIFDQFISSSEQKWLNVSGLVVYLPHGFEGQGPEHSSARIERFLTLAAENNIQIICPSTPANLFHILRLQVKRVNKKPLIIMTPKSLLRSKVSFSNTKDVLDYSKFEPIIEKTFTENKAKIKHVLFCSGKIYYDILKQIEKKILHNVSILRLEQLYPFEETKIHDILRSYSKSASLTWVQEEPENMGSWIFIQNKLNEIFKNLKFTSKLQYVGRKESSSPATGYITIHNEEQKDIFNKILSILKN